METNNNTYSKNKWAALIVAVLVLVFLVGGTMAYNRQKYNSELMNTNNQYMDDIKPSDQAPSNSVNNQANVTEATKSLTANAPQTRAGGLIVQDLTVGNGAEAKTGDTVDVNYTGMLTDGKVFDSSYPRGEAFTFTIGAGMVIQGWDEGVPGMKVGGKRKLTIPATMGYGAQGAGDAIPPNATLVFEVELMGVK